MKEEQEEENLNGHLSEKLGKCYKCGVALPVGIRRTKLFEISRTKAFAAAVCESCKQEN